MTDAYMNSVLGQTSYQGTMSPNRSVVTNPALWVAGNPSGYVNNFLYTAGCCESFRLTFTSTAVGTTQGVYGVGFDFDSMNGGQPYPYSAFVTFGDGSTMEYVLPRESGSSYLNSSSPPFFFGITSDVLIRSIVIGGPGGSDASIDTFMMDNLTIGAKGIVFGEF
jgi:hypothetical protein